MAWPRRGEGEEEGGSVWIGQSSRAQIQTLQFKSCFSSAQVSIGRYFLGLYRVSQTTRPPLFSRERLDLDKFCEEIYLIIDPEEYGGVLSFSVCA